MKIWRFAILLAVVSLIVGPAVWADVEEEETVERTATLGSGGRVVVETTNGSIKVESWSGSEVQVTARKKARADDSSRARELLSEIEIHVEERGGEVRIEADMPSSGMGSGWFRDESATVSFQIKMPADAELEARSRNGSIEAREIGGRTRLRTSNGSIKAFGVDGALQVESSNGSIKAYDVNGPVNASTNNGRITAEVTTDDLPEGFRMKTTSGAIELELDAGVAASISARTRNGSVSTDFPGGTQDRRRKTLELDLNGGGPRVEIESTNGSIRVREH